MDKKIMILVVIVVIVGFLFSSAGAAAWYFLLREEESPSPGPTPTSTTTGKAPTITPRSGTPLSGQVAASTTTPNSPLPVAPTDLLGVKFYFPIEYFIDSDECNSSASIFSTTEITFGASTSVAQYQRIKKRHVLEIDSSLNVKFYLETAVGTLPYCDHTKRITSKDNTSTFQGSLTPGNKVSFTKDGQQFTVELLSTKIARLTSTSNIPQMTVSSIDSANTKYTTSMNF